MSTTHFGSQEPGFSELPTNRGEGDPQLALFDTNTETQPATDQTPSQEQRPDTAAEEGGTGTTIGEMHVTIPNTPVSLVGHAATQHEVAEAAHPSRSRALIPAAVITAGALLVGSLGAAFRSGGSSDHKAPQTTPVSGALLPGEAPDISAPATPPETAETQPLPEQSTPEADPTDEEPLGFYDNGTPPKNVPVTWIKDGEWDIWLPKELPNPEEDPTGFVACILELNNIVEALEIGSPAYNKAVELYGTWTGASGKVYNMVGSAKRINQTFRETEDWASGQSDGYRIQTIYAAAEDTIITVLPAGDAAGGVVELHSASTGQSGLSKGVVGWPTKWGLMGTEDRPSDGNLAVTLYNGGEYPTYIIEYHIGPDGKVAMGYFGQENQ